MTRARADEYPALDVRRCNEKRHPAISQHARRIAVILGFLLGATGVVFSPILPELWAAWWQDGDNSHGLLVPLIAAWLVWIKREDLKGSPVAPSVCGLALWMLALTLYLAALKAHLAMPARASLVLAIAGMVWWNFGDAVARRLWFPLTFLVFMIPVPVSLSAAVTFPLQQLVASGSAHLLTGLGIAVLQQGNLLYFNNVSLEVAEACAGLRSLISYVTLGALFAHLSPRRMPPARVLVLLLATAPLAVGVNLLRVTGTGVLAEYFGPRMARGFLHDFSGLVVFALGFLLLGGLSVLLSRPRRTGRPGSAGCPAGSQEAL